MALTEDQINNLKPGDPLIIRGTFVRKAADSDIIVCVKMADTPNKIIDANKYINRSCIFLPKKNTEHDSYRLFKKGDKVRIVAWNGRDIARVGQVGYVVADEYNSKVELTIDGWKRDVFYPVCHLELVTPIEELGPYSIDQANTNVLLKDGKKFATFEDDNDAWTMCDRLNDECRKEYEND